MSFSVWSHVPSKEGLSPERGSLSREGVFVQGDFLSGGLSVQRGSLTGGLPPEGRSPPWTDRHLWQHYLPLRSVNMLFGCVIFSSRSRGWVLYFEPSPLTICLNEVTEWSAWVKQHGQSKTIDFSSSEIYDKWLWPWDLNLLHGNFVFICLFYRYVSKNIVAWTCRKGLLAWDNSFYEKIKLKLESIKQLQYWPQFQREVEIMLSRFCNFRH